MYYVYLLKSQKSNWFYVGCTSDLKKRLEEHNLGKSYSTGKYLPVSLIYYETYISKSDAYEREKHLKQYGSSLQKLKTRLKETLSA
ncbi:MAG: GIY-YIG nuclease family protein [Planctomycetes bacterium]|nr:GIY-YIG nuclease family protein [Planctomycetota bacterium]